MYNKYERKEELTKIMNYGPKEQKNMWNMKTVILAWE